MNHVLLIFCAVGSFVGVAFLTRLAITASHERGMLDHPNERSSHTTPTPRLGGIAILLSASSMLLVWGTLELPGTRQLIAIILSCGVIAFVGICDDFRPIRPWIRLCVQFLVIGSLVGFYHRVAVTEIWWIIVLLFGSIWFVNLFNFMDGLDGFAASEAAFILAVIGGYALMAGDPLVGGLCVIGGAAIAGFLFFNMPPAQIFLGDGGSYWIATFLIAVVSAATMREVVSASIAAILPAPFVVDATLCLIRRALRREKIWIGHRTHAYQRASDRFGGARAVTGGLFAINLLIVLPAVLAVTFFSALNWVAVLVVYVLFTAIALWLGSGSNAARFNTPAPARASL